MEAITLFEREARLIYSIIVAGKSANFADRATPKFLHAVKLAAAKPTIRSPFIVLRMFDLPIIEGCARAAKTGNYGKIAKALFQVSRSRIDLTTCTPGDLEEIHGIGPKTSRFFIMWTRPAEKFAALDVHVLRWMRASPSAS